MRPTELTIVSLFSIVVILALANTFFVDIPVTGNYDSALSSSKEIFADTKSDDSCTQCSCGCKAECKQDSPKNSCVEKPSSKGDDECKFITYDDDAGDEKGLKQKCVDAINKKLGCTETLSLDYHTEIEYDVGGHEKVITHIIAIKYKFWDFNPFCRR